MELEMFCSPKHKGHVYVNSSIPIHSWPISRRPPAFGYHMLVMKVMFCHSNIRKTDFPACIVWNLCLCWGEYSEYSNSWTNSRCQPAGGNDILAEWKYKGNCKSNTAREARRGNFRGIPLEIHMGSEQNTVREARRKNWYSN